ncbi:Uncharacterised protein [Vibrio cholerae]|nr:Uncharacterised protein [Vibrio cholerae]
MCCLVVANRFVAIPLALNSQWEIISTLGR